jgi:tRNA-2-methylthio-N6-dimethylallyladenosine synthase
MAPERGAHNPALVADGAPAGRRRIKLATMADTERPTVYVETYGCQMNASDSEIMLGALAGRGYVPVEGPQGADVILVNTCAIRDHAEQRVLGRLGELKRFMGRDAVLGVTGCMAQRMGSDLLGRAAHVSFVVGPDGYRGLASLIERARLGERAVDTAFDGSEHYEDFRPRRSPGVKAWIPVQRGCDYQCTYCIVPTTRGPERSRQLSDVVREAQAAADDGLSEVVLLGQTVNSYNDGAHDFADLIRAVGGVPGVRRLRFTSPHPNDFSDRVLSVMADTAAVCEHVHLPMQSGSTRTLRRMRRRYTREEYLQCVDRLRRAIPGLALTTDVIVGFPGESEDDFLDTLSAVEIIGFDDAYTFRFSPRPGTPATRLPPSETIADDVASDRLARLIELVRRGSRARNVRLLGTRHEVLAEKPAKRGEAVQSRTRDFKTVLLPPEEATVGSYYTATLTGTTGSTFTGTVGATRERAAARALPLAAAHAAAD